MKLMLKMGARLDLGERADAPRPDVSCHAGCTAGSVPAS